MEINGKPNNISNFLSRFKKLGSSNKKIKEVFIQELKNNYRIELEPSQVRVLQNKIYIRTTPIKKVEILKKKDEIVKSINNKLDTIVTIQ